MFVKDERDRSNEEGQSYQGHDLFSKGLLSIDDGAVCYLAVSVCLGWNC